MPWCQAIESITYRMDLQPFEYSIRGLVEYYFAGQAEQEELNACIIVQCYKPEFSLHVYDICHSQTRTIL